MKQNSPLFCVVIWHRQHPHRPAIWRVYQNCSKERSQQYGPRKRHLKFCTSPNLVFVIEKSVNLTTQLLPLLFLPQWASIHSLVPLTYIFHYECASDFCVFLLFFYYPSSSFFKKNTCPHVQLFKFTKPYYDTDYHLKTFLNNWRIPKEISFYI